MSADQITILEWMIMFLFVGGIALLATLGAAFARWPARHKLCEDCQYYPAADQTTLCADCAWHREHQR